MPGRMTPKTAPRTAGWIRALVLLASVASAHAAWAKQSAAERNPTSIVDYIRTTLATKPTAFHGPSGSHVRLSPERQAAELRSYEQRLSNLHPRLQFDHERDSAGRFVLVTRVDGRRQMVTPFNERDPHPVHVVEAIQRINADMHAGESYLRPIR